MDTKADIGKYVSRHLSQLKVLTRLLEHELDGAKGGREVTIDRDLVENVLDTLEIFVEDCDAGTGGRERQKNADAKPQVARLN